MPMRQGTLRVLIRLLIVQKLFMHSLRNAFMVHAYIGLHPPALFVLTDWFFFRYHTPSNSAMPFKTWQSLQYSTNTIGQLLFLRTEGVESWLQPTHGGSRSDDENKSSDSASNDKPNLRAKGLILVKIWCLIIVFVGGVFLGTALMHFLSDSDETFGDLTEKAYPFAFMLCTSGYLITMLGDCIIVWVYQRQKDTENGFPLERKDIALDSGVPRHTGETPLSFQVETPQQPEVDMPKASLINTTSLGDSVLLILALCFHSVFEGIAIETKADAWKALWTVCLHKIFAAIAMGIALLRMIPNRPFLSCAAYAFAFAISSPIGVAIGIIIDATTEGTVADWIYAISMGLACGVFIYVAINHLFAKGYKPLKQIVFDNPFYKFLAVVSGAGVIAVVMIWDT
eukprot:Gb_02630 [translate_table: standard]